MSQADALWSDDIKRLVRAPAPNSFAGVVSFARVPRTPRLLAGSPCALAASLSQSRAPRRMTVTRTRTASAASCATGSTRPA